MAFAGASDANFAQTGMSKFAFATVDEPSLLREWGSDHPAGQTDCLKSVCPHDNLHAQALHSFQWQLRLLTGRSSH